MTKRKRILLAAGALLLALALLATLLLTGVLKLNTPSREQYPVWGVDVSEYQGEIQWDALARQGVRFAFIKATEGSGYQDPFFAANWQGVQEAVIPAGAYHFFSFDSPGGTQAQNFLSALQPHEGMLPPVVDVELYGPHRWSPPGAEAVREELLVMLDAIQAANRPSTHFVHHPPRPPALSARGL